MMKLLKTAPADILHSHFQLGTLGAIYCRNRGLARKVIRTAHNHPRKEWEIGVYGSLRHEIVGKWIYPKEVDAVVAVSSSIAEELSKQPGARRYRRSVQTIYNAISAEIINPADVNIKQHEYPGPIIGTIGRLTPQKGYIHFVRAIPQILNLFPSAQFWFIGDGEEQTLLENEAMRLQVADQVKFLGKLPDVYATLREMDVFVLPSLWEGLPTVLLESIANNVPVVATKIPGNCEIIRDEDFGWLVPPKDPAALAEAIIDALREPELTLQRAKNAKANLNRFLIEPIAKQYEELYLNLLDQGNPNAH
jgi:glycosyltransferase involved in cell wall biosynthesis